MADKKAQYRKQKTQKHLNYKPFPRRRRAVRSNHLNGIKKGQVFRCPFLIPVTQQMLENGVKR